MCVWWIYCTAKQSRLAWAGRQACTRLQLVRINEERASFDVFPHVRHRNDKHHVEKPNRVAENADKTAAVRLELVVPPHAVDVFLAHKLLEHCLENDEDCVIPQFRDFCAKFFEVFCSRYFDWVFHRTSGKIPLRSLTHQIRGCN